MANHSLVNRDSYTCGLQTTRVWSGGEAGEVCGVLVCGLWG